jgi:hypothetical protein
MAAIIRIKRSTGTSAPGTLKTGELAYSAGTGLYNNGGDRLYFGKGDDGSGNATTVEVVGGAYFANLADHAPGTLTSSSAIITDASNKIDVLNVDNITINGNTISSTDTNGNITLDPNGSGVVDVSTSKITNVVNPTSDQDAATKKYVDDTVAANNELDIAGDAGTDNIELGSETLTFAGGTGLSSVVSTGTVTFNIDSSGVTAGSYGSSTAVPVLTVNAQGQITAATTANISTTLNLTADVGTGDVSLIDSGLEVAGGWNINTSVSNNAVTIDLDSDVLGLNSIEVGDVRITSNVISSKSTGTLYIDPNPVGDSAGGFGGELIIRGNLTVQGTTTTVNSTTVSINDKNIVLADSAANATAADGAGLTIGGALYSGTKATILYDGATDRWDLNKPLELSDSGLSTAIFLNGVSLQEVIEDHLATNYFLAGEGIDLSYVDGSNTFTIAAELATVTNPGVANFDSDQMTVTSGFVTIYQLDGGTY